MPSHYIRIVICRGNMPIKKINVREYLRDKSKMDNPEKLTTQDEDTQSNNITHNLY